MKQKLFFLLKQSWRETQTFPSHDCYICILNLNFTTTHIFQLFKAFNFNDP